ncbi:MAG: ABC transporter ATP-binding protein [Anaerolineales bacterium]|nr:ABC transporter ATP-binding protein [Anaerolineales bacterium]MCB9127924.1 ABC transporter ATP-binding protein [Ardenticatenales bacterium]MCB9171686.1 ABC transporter ATP-binding protein [Ardenticatenales bacterium]
MIIETQQLRKSFGNKVAVEDLSLTVEAGEVFGFLGPNGAGKSTTIKMLLGLVYPTSGSATLLGKPLGDPSARASVGFLPEHFRFHDWLTATEFMEMHANLCGLSRAEGHQQSAALLDLVGLAPHAARQLGTYSKGMQQRLGLAQAMLGQPALIILDEPTSGLDPVGRRLVRDIIRKLRTEGTTVFINSHLLSEIEVTCDRVAFIKRGRIIHQAPLDELMAGELRLEAKVGPISEAVKAGLARWTPHLRHEGNVLHMTLANEGMVAEVNRYLVEAGVPVYGLQRDRLSLEELFLQIVGEESSA